MEVFRKKSVIVSVVAIVCLVILGIGLIFRPGEAASSEKHNVEASDEFSGVEQKSGTMEETDEGSETSDNQEVSSEVQSEIVQTFFLYEDYTGYLDESFEWAGYTDFVEQDYDGDGAYDRVYREFITKENGTYVCDYCIELGNGERIEIRDADMVGTPEIVAFDMTGDGQNEILFRQTYEMSTDPRSAGAFTLFERKGDGYVAAELPFKRAADGSNLIELFTQQEGQTYRFSIPSLDFMKAIYVLDYEFWSEYSDIYSEEGQDVLVWYAEPVELSGETALKSFIHLFDKWSNYGIEVTVAYRDSAYVVTSVDFIEDERFNMRDKDGALKAEYVVYNTILSHPTEYLIDPHDLNIGWNGRVFAGVYDYDSNGVKELIFGDINGISIFTYEDGAAKKIKELYMPEDWGGLNGLYFEQGQLILDSNGSDGSAYVCWNGRDEGYYCDYEYPWGYINGEKTPYNVFTETFSIEWITEQRRNMPQIQYRSGEEAEISEKYFAN